VRILIADDDRMSTMMLSRALERWGFEVVVADDGTAAWEHIVGSHPPELAIVDWMMPGLDGIDLCRRIRATPPRSPMYVILLTARASRQDLVAGLEAGADDYLTKPFDFGELLARLRALTRRRGEAPASAVVIGDLVIDTLRHAVRRGRRELALTAREYDFLLYLARNAGRVVSRAELMEQVWEDTRNTYSNIIDVYASRLRRKLDDGERTALLTTLRGTGFMLEAPPGEPAKAAGRAPRRRGARRPE